MAKHMANDAVFARRIHALQHHQDATGRTGMQQTLLLVEAVTEGCCDCLTGFRIQVHQGIWQRGLFVHRKRWIEAVIGSGVVHGEHLCENEELSSRPSAEA